MCVILMLLLLLCSSPLSARIIEGAFENAPVSIRLALWEMASDEEYTLRPLAWGTVQMQVSPLRISDMEWFLYLQIDGPLVFRLGKSINATCAVPILYVVENENGEFGTEASVWATLNGHERSEVLCAREVNPYTLRDCLYGINECPTEHLVKGALMDLERFSCTRNEVYHSRRTLCAQGRGVNNKRAVPTARFLCFVCVLFLSV